jgi:branched-chain amino acid transport system permease protein
VTLTVLAIVTGLAIGSVYGLIAIGYSVVFAATGVFNLAQGDLVMLGVMLSWYLLDVRHWSQGVTFICVIVGVTLVSVAEERLIVRPFFKRPGDNIGWFIATLAFSLVIETVIINLYGDQPFYAIPSLLGGSISVRGVSVSDRLGLAFVALIVVMLAVEIFYKKTWMGTAMRAVAQDREVASLRGIDSRRTAVLAFALGGLIAGIAGFALAPIVSSNPNIGLDYGLQGFVAMAIGGFGSIRGAVVGAWILGVAEQVFDRYYSSNYEILAAVGILLLVLIVKPTGIFSSSNARSV